MRLRHGERAQSRQGRAAADRGGGRAGIHQRRQCRGVGCKWQRGVLSPHHCVLCVDGQSQHVDTPRTPASAGTSPGACPPPLTVTTSAPTVTEAFSPASVGENVVSTLTITLSNLNAFALTQGSLTETLPAHLRVSTSSSPTVP